MTGQADERSPRWLWWLAGTATVAVLLAAAGGAWYLLAGQRVWTDGANLRRPEHLANVRRVLWSAPKSAGQAVNTDQHEYEPALSPDGKALYFVRGLPGRGADLYVSELVDGRWSAATPVAAVNTDHDELGPRSSDGRLLLFYSDRLGGLGQYDLWAARRSADGWGEPLNLGPAVNSEFNEYSPALTGDGKRLIFATNRKSAARHDGSKGTGAEAAWRGTVRQGHKGDYDLFCADLAEPNAPASQPASGPATAPAARKEPPLLAFAPARELEGVNTAYDEGACCVSPGGDFLYFASNRPAGAGGFDLYRCRISAGRCGEVEALGPELNTPADEMDPQLAAPGFLIYFASNRPGGRGGFDLMTAESREVYALRSQRAPPRLSWSVWALIVAVAVLVPLLLLLRAAGYKHLNLLQKCVVLSLLAHIGITMLMSLLYIYKPILRHMAEAAGLTTAVNLELAQEVEIRTQIRQQITDLPVTELPVSDPTLAELVRPRPIEIAEAAPRMPELNAPRAEITPARMTVQPEAPRLVRPVPAPQPVSLPQPVLRTETPTVRLSPEAPLVEVETPAEAPAEAPVATDRQPTRTDAQPADVREVMLAAVPVKPQSESLAEVAAAERPAVPDIPRVAPAPTPAIQAELTVAAPRLDARRVSERPATAPAVEAVRAVTSPAQTGSPRAEASLATLAVPTATRAGSSLAVAAAVSQPATTSAAPVAIDIPAATDAPEIKLPVLASAGADTEPVPVATSLRGPRDLEARPLAGAVRRATPEPLLAPVGTGPAELAATSLLRPRSASVGRVPDAQPPVDRIEPLAMVTPLVPLTGPGRLASPDEFLQRSFEQRQKFVDAMGGSKESEDAVVRSLAFLARNQETDGHWPFNVGRRDSGRRGKNDIAITGLATLCFLAADHTPSKAGPYRQSVRKAVDYIVARQEPNGDLRAGGDMYSHAIAALAVGEAAAMTGKASYRVAAIKAGRFIVNAQNPQTGGWRYHPGDPGDTSVLGWQVMALHSAERVGMRIPAKTRKGCFRWLDRVSRSRHRMLAGYQHADPTLSMTAEAAASRIFLGEQLTPQQVKEVSDFLAIPRPKDKVNYYYWYYASLALMQIRNDTWRKWNAQIRDRLIDLQERDGSWSERRSKYGPRGGKVYATALATLTLQVYYRYYLPMYQAIGGTGNR